MGHVDWVAVVGVLFCVLVGWLVFGEKGGEGKVRGDGRLPVRIVRETPCWPDRMQVLGSDGHMRMYRMVEDGRFLLESVDGKEVNDSVPVELYDFSGRNIEMYLEEVE